MKAMPREVLEAASRIHLVGAGGIGVSALGELLSARGKRVTGADRADGETLDRLRVLGIEVRVGEAPEWAAAADLVVYTSAAAPAHPERTAAREAGRPEYPRGAVLGALVAGTRAVGIAGAHGKTTTTTMTSALCEAAGFDPWAAVGGMVAAWGSPARVGGPVAGWGSGAAADRVFVAEADESDGSFLALPLAVAVVLNVDADHLENYPSYEALRDAFRRYLEGASQAAVVQLSDPWLAEVAATWKAATPLVTLGVERPATLVLHELGSASGGVRFRVEWKGTDLGRFDLPRPGLHDAENAAAALASALLLGAEVEPLREALARFRGVDRRFSRRGSQAGIDVVDDYAHMPKEVAATLAAARRAFPERRVVAVFQPHLYSRTARHAGDFGSALEGADQALVLPIYGAREAPVPGVDSGLIAAGHERVEVLDAVEMGAAAVQLADRLRAGDALLTLGAGSVTRLGPLVLDELLRRKLAEALPGLVARHELDAPLAKASFFGIGGPAAALVTVADESELVRLAAWCRSETIAFKVLGAGSNLLVSDRGWRGVAIRLGDGFRGIEIEGDGFVAGAGVPLAILFRRLQAAGIAGFEAFHHIPGVVGGAVVNNSGAYGQETHDKLVSARVLDETGTVREWTPAELGASYRHTALKGRQGMAVLSARFAGVRGDPAAILAEAQRQASERNRTQPAGKGSAGCAFRNPPGNSAGRLIDQAGCKGWRRGGASVSDKHGNYLMSDGTATAADLLSLVRAVWHRVREHSGVELELEIELLGEFPPGSVPGRVGTTGAGVATAARPAAGCGAARGAGGSG